MSATIHTFTPNTNTALKAAINERREKIAAIEAQHYALAKEVAAVIAKRRPEGIADEQVESVADTVSYDLVPLFDEQIGEIEAEIDELDSRLMALEVQDMDDPIDLRPLFLGPRNTFHRPGPFDAA